MSALDRAAHLAEILGFAETDLLCYRAPADEVTEVLRIQQDAAFDPIVGRISHTYNAVFLITDSIMPIAQLPEALAPVEREFAAASDAELVALAQLASLFGSALLTLAVWKKFIPIETAIAATKLDEQVQAARYGLDPVIEAKWVSTEALIRACSTSLGV